MKQPWTQNERERVLDYHDLGWSASEIAAHVGRTRNSVLGVIHRRKDAPPVRCTLNYHKASDLMYYGHSGPKITLPKVSILEAEL